MGVPLLSWLTLRDKNSLVFLTCAEGRTVINIRSLSKGAVSATHIMVVTAQDHWCLQGAGKGISVSSVHQACGHEAEDEGGALQISFGFLHLENRPTLARANT